MTSIAPKTYTIQMSDGIKLEVNALNKADAVRTAERRREGFAFGSRAVNVLGEKLRKSKI